MARSRNSVATDLGLLALRVSVGGLMAGHGAQKLFGSFGGHGIGGTAGWLESIGLKPGKIWATMAGASELGSGVLTALGLLAPLGPISMFGPMIMAWAKAHGGKPIWATSGGAELVLVNLSAATAIGLAGPGRFSLDEALDLEVPAPLVGLTIVGVAAGVALGLRNKPAPASEDVAPRDTHMEAGQDRLENMPEPLNLPPLPPNPPLPTSNVQDTEELDQLLEAEVGADSPMNFGLDLRADGKAGLATAIDDEQEEH